jgi:bacillithiol biosynthesis cysteine-adding enzyme BshC
MSGKILAIDPPDSYTRLYTDFTSGRISGLDAVDGAFSETPAWKRLAKRASSERGGSPEFWLALGEFNARLGASDKAQKNAEALGRGGCLAVVGGQQPGLLGGALLVLYKAATIVALAEKVNELTGEGCAPVFIVSGDDSDFAEVSRCTLFDGSLRRLTVEFSQEGHRPGQMVGTLPAAEEKKIGASLLASAGGPAGRPFVEDLIFGAADVAADHGEFVAALLSRLFSEHGLVVLEGRSAEMRVSGRELFRSYLSRREELAAAVRAKGVDLESRGYHAQLSGPGLDWWLFLIEDGVRKKSGEGGSAALESGLANRPECISPNVALRPLWRDSTFPAVLDVLGPSEVAYTIQLREAYKMLRVSPRGMFPRLSMTLVPEEGVAVAGGWGAGELTGLVHGFESAIASHYRGLVPADAAQALKTSRGALQKHLAELQRSLGGISEEWGTAAQSVAHAGEKGLSKLENEIMESLKRDAEKANPRLKGLGDFLFPAGKLQERAVSALYPLLERGRPFIDDVLEVARAHVNECTEGRVRHYCYRLDGSK